MLVQDAYAEFSFADAFTLDAGLMFIPFSRNGLQSAGTLLPIDYGAFTFSDSAPTQSATGRDTGFQARGYFAGNRFEYRIGAFQGVRDGGSDNAFRYAGRVQYNALDTESGFFYTGTYLGKKKILSAGGYFDYQPDDTGPYQSFGGDVHADLPAGPGGVTAHVDLVRRDGKDFVALPKQTALLGELGYRVDAIKLSPIVRYEQRWSDLDGDDESAFGAGLAYWFWGHNSNLKAFYTRVTPEEPLEAYNQFNLQWQVFFY